MARRCPRNNVPMSTALELSIRPIEFRRSEISEAAAVAARALHNDPFFGHLAPDAMARARGLALYMRGHIAAMRTGTETVVAQVGGRIVGVAAWVPPGAYPLGARAQAVDLAGALRALYRRPRAIPGAARTLLAIDREHPRDPPHWYLSLLVTDPLVQRSGIGSSLLREVLDRCDTEGVPAYLETSRADNLSYYARHRFELVRELRPIPGGPSVWTMRREPDFS